MTTKICDFQHKIGYNLPCAGDTPQMLTPTSGFSGLADAVNLFSDDPCCHGNEIFAVNLPKLRLYIRYSRNFWSYGMVFGVDQLKYASRIWLRQTLVAKVTKICDFRHKIGYNIACAGDRPTSRILARCRRFSRSANLMVPVKLFSDDPGCHGNENLEI